MMNELEWKKEKDNYIVKQQKVNEVLNKFLEIDRIGNFIDPNTRENIYKALDKNKIYLEKLEKDIFEIAIVGLEKSGKSSFANCLISNYIFPSADERCTFTTTQLQYGNNEATIEFYTRDEFNNLFRSLLKEVQFKDVDKIHYDNLNLSEFHSHKEYIERENPQLYNLHQATTIKDIEDIILGRDKIKEYLGKNSYHFTNNINKEVKKFITDHYISRSVKKIIIASNELVELKNAIIYDVPGFNSPTKIHKDQTIERLKNADSIILIQSLADSPNISGTQLEILHKNIDNDGIKLKEKLFVFGNKIDRQTTEVKRNSFVNTFTNDVIVKHGLVEKDRLFIGSSGAYLVSKGIQLDEGNDQETVNLLKEFKYDNSIEKIRESLVYYYKTERFSILKRRIDTNINEIEKICKKIIEENDFEFSNYDSRFIDNEIVVSLIEDSRSFIKKELSELREKVIKDIDSHKYFSKKLEEIISKGFTPINEEKYEKIRIENAEGISLLEFSQRTNILIRQHLYNTFKDEFENIITGIANEKYKEISGKVLDLFSRALKLKDSNPYYEEVKKAIEGFIESVIKNIVYNPNSFVFLAERFSVDLFEILILHPMGSPDRKGKFLSSEQNFYSLSFYHKDIMDDKPAYEQPFIKLLLTQLPTNSFSNPVQEIEQILHQEFLTLPEYKQRAILYKNNISQYASILNSKNVDLKYIKDIAQILIKNILIHNINDLTNYKLITDSINNILSDMLGSALNGKNAKEKYIDNLLNQIKLSDTKQKVIEEINLDINNLRDLLKDTVVKAIELERPFKSVVNKQIEALKNKVSPRDTSIEKEYSNFILKYASKIEYDKFSNIDKERAIRENKKAILNSMRDLYNQLI